MTIHKLKLKPMKEKFIETITNFSKPQNWSYAQPYVNCDIYTISNEKDLRVQIHVFDDKAEVSWSGHGFCPPLIAKNPAQLLQCIQIWFRNK